MHRHPVGALVLRYHRVADLPRDPFGIAVSPARFAEHLELIRRDFVPMALADLVAASAQGSPPRRAVAITFDDGYLDLAVTARPLLERFELPATAYLITDALDVDTEPWWDTLARVVLAPEAIGTRLTLAIGNRVVAVDLAPGDDPVGEAARIASLRLLVDRLRRLCPEARERAIGSIPAGTGSIARKPDDRLLRGREVIDLDRSSAIEIGAHTESHPMLASLDPAGRAAEIGGSKRRLEALLGHPIASFAYPYGTGTRYAKTVREAGFRSACTTRARRLGRRTDPLRVPRVYVGDWDGDELARRLAAL
ncbi:MAG: polysaccharide deacetylase family protein [Gemmatimonadales bacterium]